jgi:hypothetical protein
MSLLIGERLGPYEVLAPIGKGGMGEVYRSRDTRLSRDVAVKVSAERFSERFDREARAIAALNHPNICHLYDVGPDYLVMELVEGPTLAERIREGPIPLDESLPVRVRPRIRVRQHLSAKSGTITAADLSRVRDAPLDLGRIERLFQRRNQFLYPLACEDRAKVMDTAVSV